MLPVRTAKGRFVKGQSGNPDGVTSLANIPRRKNEIIALKENLEYAVRGPGGPLSADRVCAIVMKMARKALAGDVAAARLVLALAISPAGNASDKDDEKTPGVVIKIENATFQAVKAVAEPPPVEGEFEEITDGRQSSTSSPCIGDEQGGPVGAGAG